MRFGATVSCSSFATETPIEKKVKRMKIVETDLLRKTIDNAAAANATAAEIKVGTCKKFAAIIPTANDAASHKSGFKLNVGLGDRNGIIDSVGKLKRISA
jgi:hypothetical protein